DILYPEYFSTNLQEQEYHFQRLLFYYCPIIFIKMVQTKLRRDGPIPVHRHTSTAAPNTSSAVSVANSAFVVPPADNVDSVVSIAMEVSFMELLVHWLLTASFATGVWFIWHLLH
ncbi:uncharacterized protein Bfra_002300, partial [Botrytis fragariae]